MSKTRARLRQVAGLDGLRGLAVAAVVAYHFLATCYQAVIWASTCFLCFRGF